MDEDRPELAALSSLTALGYALRQPTLADAAAAAGLINACEIADYGEPDVTAEELRAEWAETRLEDVRLVLATGGNLAGLAAVNGSPERFNFDVYAHPELPDGNLFTALLKLCDELACCRLLQEPAAGETLAVTYIAHVNARDRQALETTDFQAVRYHLRMQIDLAGPPAPVVWSEGFRLRTFVPGQDERSTYELVEAAFSRPGRTPRSLEDWSGFMLRADHFRPDLWYLLFQEDELAGCALCYDYSQYGWVRQLAVAEPHRRQGLGSMLLRHVFGEFYRRGRPRIALGVEATNAHAYSLYEKVGMRRVRQYDEYRKPLCC